VTEAEERKILRLVGLGVRARTAVIGVEQVRRATERGRVRLALVAADVSHNSRDKVLPLLRARRVPVIELPSSARLGAAAGRSSTATIGVTDARLAQGIRESVEPPSVSRDEQGQAGGTG
jgi:ribosomal protein L7Ae-like RNA K-turn-binding protein